MHLLKMHMYLRNAGEISDFVLNLSHLLGRAAVFTYFPFSVPPPITNA